MADAPTQESDDQVLAGLNEPETGGEQPKADDKPAEGTPAEETKDDQPEDTKTEDKPEPDDEPGKPEEKEEDKSEDKSDTDPKEVARQKYLERQQTRAQKDQFLQRKEQELAKQIQESDADDATKRMDAIEARQFLADVKTARDSLVLDNSRVQTIPFFNPESPEFDQELNDTIMAEYADSSLILDADGEIIGTRQPLYEYMKKEADKLERAIKRGAAQGKVQEATMRSRATVPPASGKRSGDDDDPIMKGLREDN